MTLAQVPQSAARTLKRRWRELRRSSTKVFWFLGFASIAFFTFQLVGIQGGIVGDTIGLSLIVFILVISICLWLIPRRTYAAVFAKIFGWLPVFVGAASYYLWYVYATGQADLPGSDFYHASAEVLPVLLLAAVIDVRRSRNLESRQLLLPIVVVFLGEIAALDALAFGHNNAESFSVVASSLVSTTIALVLAVMADLPDESGGDSEETDS